MELLSQVALWIFIDIVKLSSKQFIEMYIPTNSITS